MSETVAVNVPERLALRGDDTLGVICTLVDCDGDDTDDPKAAVVVVVEWPDGYTVEVLSDYVKGQVS